MTIPVLTTPKRGKAQHATGSPFIVRKLRGTKGKAKSECGALVKGGGASENGERTF